MKALFNEKTIDNTPENFKKLVRFYTDHQDDNVVNSLNNLTGDITLTANGDSTITTNGQNININTKTTYNGLPDKPFNETAQQLQNRINDKVDMVGTDATNTSKIVNTGIIQFLSSGTTNTSRVELNQNDLTYDKDGQRTLEDISLIRKKELDEATENKADMVSTIYSIGVGTSKSTDIIDGIWIYDQNGDLKVIATLNGKTKELNGGGGSATYDGLPDKPFNETHTNLENRINGKIDEETKITTAMGADTSQIYNLGTSVDILVKYEWQTTGTYSSKISQSAKDITFETKNTDRDLTDNSLLRKKDAVISVNKLKSDIIIESKSPAILIEIDETTNRILLSVQPKALISVDAGNLLREGKDGLLYVSTN